MLPHQESHYRSSRTAYNHIERFLYENDIATEYRTLSQRPGALAIEGRIARPTWNAAVATMPGGAATLLTQICAAGLFFYGYSEVAMQALANVHPVTHAIGNTMRRVVIYGVCLLVFGTPVSLLGGLGSLLAIAGTFFYAMAKNS